MGKIRFYQQRTFSEVVSTTFEFIRENWRVLLKYLVYIFLPVSLVQSLVVNELFKVTGFSQFGQMASQGYEDGDVATIIYALLMLLVTGLGSLLFYSLVFALIDIYNHRRDGLKDIVWSDFSSKMWSYFGKSVLLGLVIMFIFAIACVLMVLLAMATLFTLIVIIPAILALLIGLTFTFPDYLYSGNPLPQSFFHSTRLGFRCWLSILGITILTGLLSGVVQSITSMPWQLMLMVNAISATGDSANTMSPTMSFISYLFGVLSSFGGYFASTLIPIAVAYLYAHAKEKYDGVTVESDIDNFDNLGEREANRMPLPGDDLI